MSPTRQDILTPWSDDRLVSGATGRAVRQDRQEWIDIARGLGIILVVYGHVLRGAIGSEILPWDFWAHWLDYVPYSFHMALFFFLAGLNVHHSLRRGRHSFLETKIWTLAYPYLLWSIIQGGTMLLLGNDVNTPIDKLDLLAIWYRPIGQFWFLYSLMLCHILVAAIPSRGVLLATAGLGFVLYAALPLNSSLAWTLHYFPYYLAGVYGYRIAADWRPPARLAGLGLIMVWLTFAGCTAAAGLFVDLNPYGLVAVPGSLLGIAGMIWLSKLLEGSLGRLLASIGIMSMTIYVLHMMAAGGARVLMLKLHVPPEPSLYILVGTAAGVVLPILAHLVMAKVGLLVPLGLAPLRRKQVA